MLLLVKAAVLLSSATAPDNSLVFSIAFASVLLTFWGQFVYESGHVSLLHSFLFTNLAVLNATKLALFDELATMSIFSFVLISMPLVY